MSPSFIHSFNHSFIRSFTSFKGIFHRAFHRARHKTTNQISFDSVLSLGIYFLTLRESWISANQTTLSSSSVTSMEEKIPSSLPKPFEISPAYNRIQRLARDMYNSPDLFDVHLESLSRWASVCDSSSPLAVAARPKCMFII